VTELNLRQADERIGSPFTLSARSRGQLGAALFSSSLSSSKHDDEAERQKLIGVFADTSNDFGTALRHPFGD